jgi:hypothetical protein
MISFSIATDLHLLVGHEATYVMFATDMCVCVCVCACVVDASYSIA